MQHTVSIIEGLIEDCECDKTAEVRLREVLKGDMDRVSTRVLARFGEVLLESIRENAIRTIGS